ncbi:MAG TPA: 16S rRNA (adenine(1518)-N(6)/adenine(1519)-N(6))-dimethyltransferase RsmA, partial [Bacteroidales bacterium]|nr:16S rRNA (adenine(1518)-N(6)/adenine(1519)-N(6))-dimethyltransferase RsmA [Bacteroidales bacterium]
MHVRPKKALGQHFLHDSTVAARIVEALLSHWPLPAAETGIPDGGPDTGSLRSVVEVGPGTGVLTTLLLQEPGLDYYAVELDTESVDYLHTLYPRLGNRLVSGDFLKLPAGTFPEQFALIGNFPYNISSQIFFRVLELKDRIPLVVGMLQKEVAERFCSPPGSRAYGILSVLLQTWYRAGYLFSVAPGAFTPPPKVQSGVIRLVRNDRTA